MGKLRSLGASAFSVLLLAFSLGTFEGVKAQITSNATCAAQFGELFNSRGQSPCLIAAYLGGQCNGGQYDVSGLLPNQHYIGPSAALADPCQCNTVMYSVMAACSTCQNASVVTWSSWSEFCTEVFRQIFPRNIPSNTAIPGWAYQDVVPSDTFDLNAALDSSAPESTPSVSQITQTGRPTSTGRPSPTGGSGSGSSNADDGGGGSNTGAIVGGVVGGIAGLAIIALIIFFVVRRQRRKAAAAQGTQLISGSGSGSGSGGSPYMQQTGGVGAGKVDYAQTPLMPGSTGTGYTDVPYSPTPVSAYGHGHAPGVAGLGAGGVGLGMPSPGSGRLYDPNDPSTFPTSPGPPTFQSQYTGPTTGSGSPHMPIPQQQYAPPGGIYRGAPEV